MHAYDRARLSGAIRVRAAARNERLTLLDDREYVLDPDFMVIADDSGAIGLAGIMGGRATAIGEGTTDVLLEARALYAGCGGGACPAGRPVHRCRAALRARRRSDAAGARARARNGVDPVDRRRRGRSPAGHACGRSAAGHCAVGQPAPHRLARLLGVAVPDEEVGSVMSAISDGVEPIPAGWRVRRPPHRFDVRIEADLIEEVARLRGFDSIAESHAIDAAGGRATQPSRTYRRIDCCTAMVDRGLPRSDHLQLRRSCGAAPIISGHSRRWRSRIRSPRI